MEEERNPLIGILLLFPALEVVVGDGVRVAIAEGPAR